MASRHARGVNLGAAEVWECSCALETREAFNFEIPDTNTFITYAYCIRALTYHTAVMGSVPELICSLVCEWYSIKFPTIASFEAFSEEKFAHLWTTVWFAKNEAQVRMDAQLLKYRTLFDVDDPEHFKPSHTSKGVAMFYDLGWLLLYDQVSRNIFRRTERAYATDANARALAERLMSFWDILPIPCRVSLVLVYVHSEAVADLAIVQSLLGRIKTHMSHFPTVNGALLSIADNHKQRMILFRRIPERNKYVGRESSAEELAFMAAFQI